MASTNKHNIKRALISVYDKTGIVDFARALVDEFGIEIISTGGTASLLKENGIPVTLVEQITGFPEMLDGRVKTLHPKIHAAILADRDNPEHMRQLKEQGIEPIDMVVVNLYPFEKTVADPNCTFEQAIEMIDIGGPCLLRAAAKNHRHVVVLTTSVGYDTVLGHLRSRKRDEEDHCRWAALACQATSRYDACVSNYLHKAIDNGWPLIQSLIALGPLSLKYGENPHSVGAYYAVYGHGRDGASLFADITVSDNEFSYNNFLDGDAAIELCKEMTRELCTSTRRVSLFVKHNNPCGVAISHNSKTSFQRAYLGDPNAAMGGVLACNFEVDAAFAETVMETYARWGKDAGAGGFFVEVWIAPEFHQDAINTIRTAKEWGQRVRLLAVGDMSEPPDPKELEYKSISGGILVQTRDLLGLNEDKWKVVTKRQPSDQERSDLRLAWLIAKHTKSNAISICKEGMLIGNGAGQMSRVMSCRIATWLANENGHKERLAGSVAASDAFFPFPDGPNILIDAGVTAIIQPGGSKRDEEVIGACDARDVAMIFTGTRHFKH
jgi:phosphoribosylaminoimidazolecarboxamide formyltransferase / IMP cyclohydrolase